MPDMSQEQWDAILKSLGPVEANAWLARRNQELSAELPPSNPAQPPVYATPAPSPLAAVSPAGSPPMPTTPAPGALPSVEDVYGQQAQLNTEMMDFLKRTQTRRDDAYAAATEALKSRRFGPSRAEQLFALSAALAKPTYAGNRFGQILGNVAPALGDMAGANRQAEEQRDEAKRALVERYLTGSENTELAVMQQKGKALNDRADFVAALNKPKTEFSYQLDQSGNVREIPKDVARPMSKAEFDAIPVGKYYRVPSGPSAGMVVMKTGSQG